MRGRERKKEGRKRKERGRNEKSYSCFSSGILFHKKERKIYHVPSLGILQLIHFHLFMIITINF